MRKGNTQFMHDDDDYGKKSIKSRCPVGLALCSSTVHLRVFLMYIYCIYIYKPPWCHHIGIKQQEVIWLVQVICECSNIAYIFINATLWRDERNHYLCFIHPCFVSYSHPYVLNVRVVSETCTNKIQYLFEKCT